MLNSQVYSGVPQQYYQQQQFIPAQSQNQQQQINQNYDSDDSAEELQNNNGKLNSPTKALLYNKQQWIKAVYNGMTKRINNPPKNLMELIERLKDRFKELRDTLEADKTLWVKLMYIDDEEELTEVEDSRDLILAYKYAEYASEQRNIIKFQVVVYQRSQEEIENSAEKKRNGLDPDIAEMQQRLLRLQDDIEGNEGGSHANKIGDEDSIWMDSLLNKQAEGKQEKNYRLTALEEKLRALMLGSGQQQEQHILQQNEQKLVEEQQIVKADQIFMSQVEMNMKEEEFRYQDLTYDQLYESQIKQPSFKEDKIADMNLQNPQSQSISPPSQPIQQIPLPPNNSQYQYQDENQNHSLFNQPSYQPQQYQPQQYQQFQPMPYYQPPQQQLPPQPPPPSQIQITNQLPNPYQQPQNPQSFYAPSSSANAQRYGQQPQQVIYPPQQQPQQYNPYQVIPPIQQQQQPPLPQQQIQPQQQVQQQQPPQQQQPLQQQPPYQQQPSQQQQQNLKPVQQQVLQNLIAPQPNQAQVQQNPLQTRYLPVYFKIQKTSDQNFLKQQEHVGAFKKFFNKFQSMDANQISEELKKQSIILSHKECYEKAFPGGEILMKWVIQNKSNQKWDKPCILKNLNNDPYLKIPDFSVHDQDRLEAGKIREITLKVFVPKDYPQNQIFIVYQFQSQKTMKEFGETLVGVIDIISDNKLDRNSNLNESVMFDNFVGNFRNNNNANVANNNSQSQQQNRNQQQQQVQQQPQQQQQLPIQQQQRPPQPPVIYPQQQQQQVFGHQQQPVQQNYQQYQQPQPNQNQVNQQQNNQILMDDDFLFALAQQLVEEGYGEYLQCYDVLRKCNGNYEEAKIALSKIIQEQFSR